MCCFICELWMRAKSSRSTSCSSSQQSINKSSQLLFSTLIHVIGWNKSLLLRTPPQTAHRVHFLKWFCGWGYVIMRVTLKPHLRLSRSHRLISSNNMLGLQVPHSAFSAVLFQYDELTWACVKSSLLSHLYSNSPDPKNLPKGFFLLCWTSTLR